MKVLIASAPHADTFGYSMPPPGLLRLGGAARAAGIDLGLDDLSYRLGAGDLGADADGTLAERSARYLAGASPPDLFGLSVMGATLPIALAILARLRDTWPKTRFALGGPGVHGVEERLLERFPALDLVVRGEAEVTLVELVGALGSGAPLEVVDGLVLRGPGGAPHRTPDRAQIADLGALPDYAWDLLPSIADYKALRGAEDGLVPLDSGRGCAYDCSFCSIGRYWKRRSRPLPAERLADEIVSLSAIPGALRAYLCHDLFGADRRHALALCDALEARGNHVPWEIRARIDHLDDELLDRLGRAGCDRVLLGIESASHAVRAENQKGMRSDIDLLGRVEACVANGVTPILSVILGLPGEDDDALEASLDLCASAALHGGVQVSLHLVNPQPGCALGDTFGAESRPVEGVPPDMALGAGDSPEERALIEEHPDLFSTWALLPMPSGTLDELRFLKDELAEVLMRYPRAFAALRAAGGTRALDLARAWRADGRTFETFAEERGVALGCDALVRTLLDWEGALVRVAARGPRRAIAAHWRSGGELLDVPFDLTALSDALSESPSRAPAACADLPSPAASRATFAVAVSPPRPGGLPRIRTLRVGAGAARIVRGLAATDAAERARIESALDPAHPSVRALVDAGLLVPPLDSEDPRSRAQARTTVP